MGYKNKKKEGIIMGAYYEYQLFKNGKELVSFNPIVLEKAFAIKKIVLSGMSFIEQCYMADATTAVLLELLRDNKDIVVNTVSDYDNVGQFKNMNDRWGKLFSDRGFKKSSEQDLIIVKKVLYILNEICVKGNEDYAYNNFKNYYLICNDKKQYISLDVFFKDADTFSPIALLTRSSAYSLGGGDLRFSSIDDNYIHLGSFDVNLIGSFKDLPVRLDTNKPCNYEDISEKILLIYP